MNRPVGNSHPVGVPIRSAIHKVRFGKQSRPHEHHVEEKPIGRVPRVTRLLALAHRINGMIRSGELKDWAEAARLIGVTRARMTQIANLLLLTPECQHAILNLGQLANGKDSITEHHLRSILTSINWQDQRRTWLVL